MTADYPIVVYPDYLTDGSACYVAEHPDLPGCVAQGDTIQEAKLLLMYARRAYEKDVLAAGDTMPPPSVRLPSSAEMQSTGLSYGGDAMDSFLELVPG
jgi:predicted RNase H-like HicB family nuclease